MERQVEECRNGNTTRMASRMDGSFKNRSIRDKIWKNMENNALLVLALFTINKSIESKF